MVTHFAFGARFIIFYFAWREFIAPDIFSPTLSFIVTTLGIHHDAPAHVLLPGLIAVFDITWLLFVLAWTALLVLTERRPSNVGYGTLVLARSHLAGGRPWMPCFAVGLLLGGSIAIAMIGSLVATGFMHASLNLKTGNTLLQGQLLLLLASFLPGLAEETVFRGYAQYLLTRSLTFWPATIITSYWFAHGHYGEGDPLMGAIGVAEFAVFSCLALRATGNLALSIGFHGAWNFVENAVFGTLDSGFTYRESLIHTSPAGPAWLTGGSAGPEGSIVFLLINTALIIGMLVWSRKHPPTSSLRMLAVPRAGTSCQVAT